MFRQSRGHNQRSTRQGRYTPKPIAASLFVKKAQENTPQNQQAITHQFTDFLISDQLKRNIQEKGYQTPTPIQDQVIPLALQNNDIVGIANTGTGKTGAFLIPLINKVLFNRSQKILIVAPTRELAVQIEDEFKAFSKHMNIFSVLCIGGASIHNQIYSLRRNHNFVIGTPGRLKDLKQQGKLQFALYNNIVLDEVDRMMDMGFIHDVKFIISHLPNNRQSLFFSATISTDMQGIIKVFLRNPITISVKSQDTAAQIEQDVIKVNGRAKADVLYNLLIQEDFKKVLIFGRTKWGMEKLAKILIQKGVNTVTIHGNKSQGQRQRALEQFKRNVVKVLLATDLASRGLDIDDITHVINYDQPASYDDYIHRIGRTGRANKKGFAITFVD